MSSDSSAPIWEDLAAGAPTQPARGNRIYADGRFLEYSATRLVVEGEGRSMKMRSEPRPLDWYPLTTLPPAKVERLQKLIEESGFFALPPVIDYPGVVMDSTTWTVTARVGGRSHTVQVLKSPMNRPPKLLALVNQIAQLAAP